MRDDIRERYPKMAARARSQRSSAIRLFCTECMGGSMREAKDCETTDCFLWPVAWRR